MVIEKELTRLALEGEELEEEIEEKGSQLGDAEDDDDDDDDDMKSEEEDGGEEIL